MLVVGAGISGLTAAVTAQRAGLEVTVLEAGAAPGGKSRSSQESGYTFDWGPNGFLTNVPDAAELAASVGLRDAMLPASEAAERRYLFWDGGLRPIPASPGSFLRSELLSPPGKLRVLAEALYARSVRREESVQGFITRHFGYEAARVFAGPFVQGISAGDARRLSLDAMFPRLRQLEASHGSLLRGLAAARYAAQSGARRRGPARLTSFRAGGMQRLVDALAAELGDRIRTDAPVSVIRHAPGREGETGVVIVLESGETIEDERLVIATPAPVAADLVDTLAPEASAALREIRYVDIDVLGFGFDRIDVPYPLDGFGFLVPRGQQKVRVLGASWHSVLFSDQAPEGKVGIRVLAGGALDPGFCDLTEEEALRTARRDLEATMGIVAEPEYQRMIRWRRGIPQFELGHHGRTERARAALTLALPGARLAGNYLDGVGLNDAVRTARAAARSLLPLAPEAP